MKIRNKLKYKVPLYAVLILLFLSGISAYALIIHTLPTQRIGLWSGTIQDSNFSVSSMDVKFQGPNKITITIVVHNNDASNSHQANVDVAPLDSSGNQIMSAQTQSTGVVNAGSSTTLTYTFQQSNISSQYSSAFIQITDTS